MGLDLGFMGHFGWCVKTSGSKYTHVVRIRGVASKFEGMSPPLAIARGQSVVYVGERKYA